MFYFKIKLNFLRNYNIKKIDGFGKNNKATKIAAGEYHAHVINEYGDVSCFYTKF